MIYLWISIGWVLIAGAALILLFQRHRALKPLEDNPIPTGSWPSLTVIIPARNEEDNIEACLRSLLDQSYPRELARIRVVDDASSDRTADIVTELAKNHPQIELVQAGPLPEGWLGKPHACWIAASTTDSDWICFLDADTRAAPDLLKAAVSEALSSHADLLSLHPGQQMLGFWERLLMPIPFMTLMLLMDADAINDPERTQAMANGQFILVRREAYLAVGGHQAIRSVVLEDVRLAQNLKGAGYRLRLVGGGKLIETRMYSELRTVWQGLARGGSELLGIPLTLLAVISSLGAAVFPILLPWWLVEQLSHGSGLLPALVLACLGSILWYTAHLIELRRHRVPPVYLIMVPLSNLLIAIVNLEGVVRRVSGRRIWKDRRV